MSSQNPNQPYERLAPVLDFVFEQGVKSLWTAMPGNVIAYDAGTRTARVQPALRVVLTDGTEMSLPPVSQVPVLMLAGGGCRVNVDLEAGDSVLLVFAQRGLDEWKKIYDEATPDSQGMLSLKDAIAIPGFVRPDRSYPTQLTISASGIVLDGNLEVTGAMTVTGDLAVTGNISAPGGSWHPAA